MHFSGIRNILIFNWKSHSFQEYLQPLACGAQARLGLEDITADDLAGGWHYHDDEYKSGKDRDHENYKSGQDHHDDECL